MAERETTITTSSLIEVHGLTFDYRARRALDDLSFSIPRGSVTALVGPNGAGKTTLLRCLAGLEEPLAGRISVDGVDVLANPRQAHLRIGFLQDFFGVYEALTVRQNVYHAAAIMRIPRARANEAVRIAIEAVSLGDHINKKAAELSRGLRQRLALARTIVHQPKVMFLDEPASGLDPEARRELTALIRHLQAAGTTMIVSSHILTELEDYSTHMLSMRDGQLRGPVPLGGQDLQHRGLKLSWLATGADAAFLLGGMPDVANVTPSQGSAVFDYAGTAEGQHELLKTLMANGVMITEFAAYQQNLEQLYFAEPAR